MARKRRRGTSNKGPNSKKKFKPNDELTKNNLESVKIASTSRSDCYQNCECEEIKTECLDNEIKLEDGKGNNLLGLDVLSDDTPLSCGISFRYDDDDDDDPQGPLNSSHVKQEEQGEYVDMSSNVVNEERVLPSTDAVFGSAHARCSDDTPVNPVIDINCFKDTTSGGSADNSTSTDTADSDSTETAESDSDEEFIPRPINGPRSSNVPISSAKSPHADSEVQEASSSFQFFQVAPSNLKPLSATFMAALRNGYNLDPETTINILLEHDLQINTLSKVAQNDLLRVPRATPILPGTRFDGSDGDLKDVINGVGISEHEYRAIQWLTGSWKHNTYHCWPCLLFIKCGTHEFNTQRPKWTLPAGALKEVFWEAMIEHDTSVSHHTACAYFNQRLSELKGSKKLKSILRLPSNGSDQTQLILVRILIHIYCNINSCNTNLNFDTHEDILNLVISFDPELQQSIGEILPSYTDLKKFISNKAQMVLSCIETQLFVSIGQELTRSHHVSIIYEDTKNIVEDNTTVAVIIRYQSDNGDICERIARFIKIGRTHNDAEFFETHLKLVNALGLKRKLVGFTFSGTIIPPSRFKYFNDNVSRISERAKFFHHPDHDLKELLLQSLSYVKQCKTFLVTIQNLVSFLAAGDNNVMSMLASFINLSEPDSELDTARCFSVDIFTILKDYFPIISKFFSATLQNIWFTEITTEVCRFNDFLHGPFNQYLIVVIAAIMDTIDELSQVMKKGCDSAQWKTLAQKAHDDILKLQGQPLYFYSLISKFKEDDNSDHDYIQHPYLRVTNEFVEALEGVTETAANVIQCRALESSALAILPFKSAPSSSSSVLRLKSYMKNSFIHNKPIRPKKKDKETFNTSEAMIFLEKDYLHSLLKDNVFTDLVIKEHILCAPKKKKFGVQSC